MKNSIKERKKEKRYPIMINSFLRSLGVRLHVVQERAAETSNSLLKALNSCPVEYATLFAYHIFVGVLDKVSNYNQKKYRRDLVEIYASAAFIHGLPQDAFGLNAVEQMEQETEANAEQEVVLEAPEEQDAAPTPAPVVAPAAAMDMTGEEKNEAAPEASGRLRGSHTRVVQA